MRSITLDNYIDGKMPSLMQEMRTSEDYEEFMLEQEEETREYILELESKFFRFREEW